MSLGPERSDVSGPAPSTGEQRRQLALAGTSDHCVNCGTQLASDQRYCVVCGERRGKPRFALAAPAEEPVRETVTHVSGSTARRTRTSAGFNLIAGVATLLLAMGVGVLIGHNNSSGSTNKTQQPAITINGGGTGNASAGSSTATTGSGSAGSTASTGKSKKGGSTKSAATSQPKVVIQKAAAAASKVTGGNAKVANPTATQGSSCTAGTAGCQNGKLTGNYFGQ